MRYDKKMDFFLFIVYAYTYNVRSAYNKTHFVYASYVLLVYHNSNNTPVRHYDEFACMRIQF